MSLIKASSRRENKLKFPFENAYFKIMQLRQEQGNVFIQVKVYADTEARNLVPQSAQPHMPHESDGSIQDKQYTFPETDLPEPKLKVKASELLKHCCYLWLKKHTDFAEAKDKLEDGQNVPA